MNEINENCVERTEQVACLANKLSSERVNTDVGWQGRVQNIHNIQTRYQILIRS